MHGFAFIDVCTRNERTHVLIALVVEIFVIHSGVVIVSITPLRSGSLYKYIYMFLVTVFV